MIWNPDPIIFTLGPLELRWYGLLFVSGFLIGFYIMSWMYKREGKDLKQLDRLLYYMFIGAVIGARLGHVMFYEPEYYLSHPIEILYVWKGGLASHGGTVGMLLAVYLFQRTAKETYLNIIDRLSVPISLGAMSIRLGNFFNSEILGDKTDSIFGIVFLRVDNIARHPAQLYEAGAYLFTLIVLLILYKTRANKWADGFMTGFMFVSIFTLRFLIEFVKQEQTVYSHELPLNVGHLLSIPFIILGLVILYISYRNTQKQGAIQNP